MNKLTDFPYQNILVVGLAKSGTATCRVLANNGYQVSANDLKASSQDPEVQQLQALGVKVVVGSHPLELLDNIDVIIKNPGIPYQNVLIEQAITRGIPVLTEIELVSYLTTNPVIAITGSNGKTTTTMLAYEMLSESNKKVKIAGNIGTVAIEVAEELNQDEQLVLELSSFQLMGTETFKPKIAVLLNLFSTHLDYHGTLSDYIAAKARIFANQTEDDYLIYNANDRQVVEVIKKSPAIKVPFSSTKRLETGAWCDETDVYFKTEKVIAKDQIRLVGTHSLENILASIAASMLSGATIAGIQQVLKTFDGVRHRLQFVDQIHGRLFYNDSKATNILACSKALQSFTQPVILLAGGLDRGNNFDELRQYLGGVKAMVVYGQTADKLAETARETNIEVISKVNDLTEAVKIAYQHSEVNDVILLSPACASWDQFATFEKRGDMFIDLVHRLK